MAYRIFFDFSTGLSRPIQVPAGTLKTALEHVELVEKTLGFERTQYLDNPVRWKSLIPAESVTDKIFCEVAEEHNQFVRKFYQELAEWAGNPPKEGELLTPEHASKFWHGLVTIPVPPSSWTPEYYIRRMEAIYEVLRGRESKGIIPEGRPLGTRQAAFVIRLFAEFLDPGDRRLDVPLGCDHLASSYDGGYEWCEKCGPVTEAHYARCQKRKCPLREEA